MQYKQVKRLHCTERFLLIYHKDRDRIGMMLAPATVENQKQILNYDT